MKFIYCLITNVMVSTGTCENNALNLCFETFGWFLTSVLTSLLCFVCLHAHWCVLVVCLGVGPVPGAWRTEEGRAWTWESPRLPERPERKAATALITQPVANKRTGSVTTRHVWFRDPGQPRLRLHWRHGDRPVRGTGPVPLPSKSWPARSSPGLLGGRRGRARSGEPQRGPTTDQSASAWTRQAERALLSRCRRGRHNNWP